MTEPVVTVHQVTKTFDVRPLPNHPGEWVPYLLGRRRERVEALRGISFALYPGELVALLGPNGAGKTTTLRLLAGILHPDRGDIRVLGYRPHRRDRAFLRQIGLVMAQQSQLLWDLRPVDTYELHRVAYGIDRNAYQQRLAVLSDTLGVRDLVFRRVRELSLGQRMRCELLMQLLHRPRVLFLDEPTHGLDFAAQQAIRQFLPAFARDEGVTVLITSHNVDDILMCDRVLVMGSGTLVFAGTVGELLDGMTHHVTIRVRFEGEPEPVPRLPDGPIERNADGVWRVRASRHRVPEVVRTLLAAGHVTDLSIERPAASELVADLYRRLEPTR